MSEGAGPNKPIQADFAFVEASCARNLPEPFLKWAGGKRQLLGELMGRILRIKKVGRYHEPFLGGGALFFELFRVGALEVPAYLSDTNANLIVAYEGVKYETEQVIEHLKGHHRSHCRDHYYCVRAAKPESLAARAARVIYLNRTCFNGLFRENRKGEFNVPMGRYKNPRICDEANLRAVAAALKEARVETRPFETVLDHARSGDLVYFDPPYHPVSDTANFTAYQKGGFGEADQRALADVAAELSTRGVFVLLSNSWTPFVCELYADFTLDQVLASRNVNSRADKRGAVPEILARNF